MLSVFTLATKYYFALWDVHKMTLKQLWVGTSNWLRIGKIADMFDHQPQVDDDGLLSHDADPDYPDGDDHNGKYLVKTVSHTDKRDAMEKLQDGFNSLLEQLQGINDHLNSQVTQHQELMTRIENLPQWMQAVPDALEDQKQVTHQMLEQLKTSTARQEQFADAVAQIPTQTSRQTDALVAINHQLAAAADTDVQMVENFNNFYKTLNKLDESTRSHTDGIHQMARTFAMSERYLKYVVSRQNKRFLWVFVGSITVCFTVICALAGIILYLAR